MHDRNVTSSIFRQVVVNLNEALVKISFLESPEWKTIDFLVRSFKIANLYNNNRKREVNVTWILRFGCLIALKY